FRRAVAADDERQDSGAGPAAAVAPENPGQEQPDHLEPDQAPAPQDVGSARRRRPLKHYAAERRPGFPGVSWPAGVTSVKSGKPFSIRWTAACATSSSGSITLSRTCAPSATR